MFERISWRRSSASMNCRRREKYRLPGPSARANRSTPKPAATLGRLTTDRQRPHRRNPRKSAISAPAAPLPRRSPAGGATVASPDQAGDRRRRVTRGVGSVVETGGARNDPDAIGRRDAPLRLRALGDGEGGTMTLARSVIRHIHGRRSLEFGRGSRRRRSSCRPRANATTNGYRDSRLRPRRHSEGGSPFRPRGDRTNLGNTEMLSRISGPG